MAIIFLNGCTSAGKTTLTRALQDMLPGAWLRTGIDDAIAMLGHRYHGHHDGFHFDVDGDGLVRLNFGSAGLAALAAHRRAAAAIAASGANLVIDEVLLSEMFVADWLAVLPDVPVLMVGVHCALATLERREQARGDRVIGQARGQFDHVHRHAAYDVKVETDGLTPHACARIIADAFDAGDFRALAGMKAARALTRRDG